MEECFGELYCLPLNEGKWNQDIIQKMSILNCSFNNEITNELPNGINISYINHNSFKLGKEISSFIIRSYLIKYIGHINGNGEYYSYLAPVNIFLDSIDRSYSTLINQTAIENMKTILNHPHFSTCKSIDDIKELISTVKDLNLRFIYPDL
tara:strand:+ start:547 stop:999 length:453 start_codon:yes stop_codon:yes gene_type:complete